MSFPPMWSNWVDYSYPIVFRAVYNALRRRDYPISVAIELSQEATQDAYASLLVESEKDKPPQFEVVQQFTRWLQQTAINAAWESVRKKKASPHHKLDHAINTTESEYECIANERTRISVLQVMRSCLEESFSQEERELLRLKFTDELSDKAIADKMFASDSRSQSAKGQDLRRRRLELMGKLKDCLQKKGVSYFPEDSDFDYTDASFFSDPKRSESPL